MDIIDDTEFMFKDTGNCEWRLGMVEKSDGETCDCATVLWFMWFPVCEVELDNRIWPESSESACWWLLRRLGSEKDEPSVEEDIVEEDPTMADVEDEGKTPTLPADWCVEVGIVGVGAMGAM